MDKKVGPNAQENESLEICEIIETSIDQVDLLTKAFELIKAACEEPNQEWIDSGQRVPEFMIN